MSNKLTIHYSVDNCGDGSAYPRLYDTKQLARWHQDHLDDGWGEPCVGTIDIEGDNLRCEEMQTKEGYYLELLLDEGDNLEGFVAEFFHNGLPEFTVKILDTHRYGIYTAGRFVYAEYVYPEKESTIKGIKKLEKRINRHVF